MSNSQHFGQLHSRAENPFANTEQTAVANLRQLDSAEAFPEVPSLMGRVAISSAATIIIPAVLTVGAKIYVFCIRKLRGENAEEEHKKEQKQLHSDEEYKAVNEVRKGRTALDSIVASPFLSDRLKAIQIKQLLALCSAETLERAYSAKDDNAGGAIVEFKELELPMFGAPVAAAVDEKAAEEEEKQQVITLKEGELFDALNAGADTLRKTILNTTNLPAELVGIICEQLGDQIGAFAKAELTRQRSTPPRGCSVM